MKISEEHFLERFLDPLKMRILKQMLTGGVLTERRLAKYVGVSHVTVHKILGEFAQCRLASSKRIGRANLWSVNKDSYAYQAIEPLLAASDQIIKPLEWFKKVLRQALPVDQLESMALFGSIANGEERDDSDIDLALILRRGVDPNNSNLEKGIEISVEECYRLFGKRLSPFILSHDDWSTKRNTRLGQSIEQGIAIYP